jgi:hypothetical protein
MNYRQIVCCFFESYPAQGRLNSCSWRFVAWDERVGGGWEHLGSAIEDPMTGLSHRCEGRSW